MTIATTSNKVIGQGNGATTNWPFNFLIPDQASLVVLYTDANGLITFLSASQYTVAGLGSSAGGSVTYPLSGAPIALGTTLTVLRDVSYVQQRSITNQGGFFPDVYESALDYLTMQTQQLSEAVGRCLAVPVTITGISTDLPAPLAGAAIGWSADGLSLVNLTTLAGAVGLPLAVAQGGTGKNGLPAALDALMSKGADVVAAATIDLDNATGDLVDVTGNTGITAITLGAGKWRTTRFTGTPTLTNGASLDLVGGANITMAAGDRATWRGYAGGVVRMMSFVREAGGESVLLTATQTLTNKTFTNPANTVQALVDAANVAWNTANGAYATLTLTANRTMSAPTNLKAGGHYALLLTSAGFTPTWNAVFKGVAGGGIPAPAASGTTAYLFESDGVNLYLTGMPIFTTLTNSLAADVSLNNAANYFDGPTVAQGTVGVWFASGTVTFGSTTQDHTFAKLWDGTTVIASGAADMGGANLPLTMSLSGFITNPAGNLRISGRDSSGTNGKLLFNQSGNSKDCTITVVRIG